MDYYWDCGLINDGLKYYGLKYMKKLMKMIIHDLDLILDCMD
jgi:hypothetical protein